MTKGVYFRSPERIAELQADCDRLHRLRYGSLSPQLAPTESATPSDFRWAAGLYEGEGTCQKSAYSNRASVYQKDTWVLERLRALFGGSIYRQSRCSNWHTSGARARGFLMSIYGLLSPRRQEQIRKCLSD